MDVDTARGLARRVRHDHTKGLWRQGWVWVVAVFTGVMYAIVVTTVVGASGLWTGRLLCGGGEHMVYGLGPGAYYGASRTLACVGHGARHGVSAAAVGGLQLLPGILGCYVLILLIGGIRRLRRVG